MTLQQEQLPFSQFARKVVKACADKLAAFTPCLAFCHNDFHQANVLFSDGKAWIVDWATGCIGDPMRDVAYFACRIEIQGSTDLEALLQKYDANLSQEDVLRAKCWFAWMHAHTYLRLLLDTSLGNEQEKAARLLMSEAVLVDAIRGLDLNLGLEGVSVLRAEVSTGSPGAWTALADFLYH
jgi:thiamine kinase-like enzyme